MTVFAPSPPHHATRQGLAALLVILLPYLVVCSARAATPVALENAQPGDASWVLTDPADHEIEGYASATSINRGESLRFYVSTRDPRFSLTVYRMGWYGGVGARRMTPDIELPGVSQPMPTPDPQTGLIECDWTTSYRLQTSRTEPDHWRSGIYLVKLTARPSGKQSYLIFVIREDERDAAILFQQSVTTYQAYNSWGGKSTYPTNSDGQRWAQKVSFNRPYARSMHPRGIFGVGAGDFLTATSIHEGSPASPAGWDYNMVRWLEREGYDVTYSTNVDTHANPTLWKGHKVWLSVGHDEYWSQEMRRHVEAARDHGLSLAFFSANTCYWQIRFEPSPLSGEPLRTMVAYKETAPHKDPYLLDDEASNDHLATTQWREAPVSNPEHRLIGVMFETVPTDGDIQITAPAHPLFQGVPLPPDRRLPGLLGYEIDRRFPDGPSHLVVLAHSPYPKAGPEAVGDMTLYQAESGAYVFATGSMQWSWGLDDYNVPGLRSSRLNQAAQHITRNVLQLLSGEPAPSQAQSPE